MEIASERDDIHDQRAIASCELVLMRCSSYRSMRDIFATVFSVGEAVDICGCQSLGQTMK